MSKTIWIINQYASTPDTGMGGRHYYLARSLGAMGYKIYVIAASYTHLLRNPPKVVGDVLSESREGVNMVWIKMPHYKHAHSKKRILNWFYFAFKLLRLDRTIPDKPDVILYSSPSLVGYLGAERLARKIKARLAFEVRDIWPLTLCIVGGYSPLHPFIRTMQWIENRAYRNSDIVISNLKYAYEHMVQHGLDESKFHWIPNGISLAEVSHPEPLNENTIKVLPKNKFIIGYAGTLGLANCLRTLIEAAIILKYDTNILFVIVGGGREKAVLEDMARKAQLKNISFIDAIPKVQIQAILQRFDALYIGAKKAPIYKYGVSMNKIFDYLYAGKPILYAIESGNYHPIAQIGAGIELPAEDPDALANAILYLQDLPERDREIMGINGRRLAIDQYEYGALAKKLALLLFR